MTTSVLNDLLDEAAGRFAGNAAEPTAAPKNAFVDQQERASAANGIWRSLPEDRSSEPWAVYSKTKGLDFKVDTRPMLIDMGNGVTKRSDARAIIRVDTGQEFGVVGKRYKAIDNTTAFGAFDDLVSTNRAQWVNAGMFDGGAKVWGQITANWNREIVPNDSVRYYGFLSTTHDGSGRMVINITAVRVNCINTYQLALREGSEVAKIKHTAKAGEKISAASELLDSMILTINEETELYKMMASRRVTTDDIMSFLHLVVPDPVDLDAKRAKKNAIMVREEIMDVLRTSRNLREISDTVYGVWNAGTEYVDHHKKEDARGDQLEYILDGGGHKWKTNYRAKLMENFDLM